MKKKIHDKEAQRKKPKDEQAQGRTDFGTRVVCVIGPIECYRRKKK